MPRTCTGTADVVELTETLQLIAGWLAADPATLGPSLLGYVGHPAYGLDALRTDLDRGNAVIDQLLADLNDGPLAQCHRDQ
jgi:hypothetical protein